MGQHLTTVYVALGLISSTKRKKKRGAGGEQEREERKRSQVVVAHACNPSYSRGRDQEDFSSKPARTNSL
jgi:hypothetical protein